jgi:enoyl-[acyl-carrier protein] reductase II
MVQNRVTKLFNIKYPLIQAGMVWASGWKLASAVSNAGGLGLIGAGSMHPDNFRHHIHKCREATDKPFGVNLPLLLPTIDQHIRVVLEEKVPIVFTSAGNPKSFTKLLKDNGVKVVHVVSSAKFAQKAEQAGCDAVVAEGFEAGGHNGREETTTLVLIPGVVEAVKIPVLAAGGIYSGRSMLASMVLGAEGVQIGSRFVCAEEASSHPEFKQAVVKSQEGDTKLMMKNVTPVRLLRNKFAEEVAAYEARGANTEEMKQLLGRGRSKVGMFEGKLEDGELEIGQVSALINNILPAGKIVEEIMTEFNEALKHPLSIKQ